MWWIYIIIAIFVILIITEILSLLYKLIVTFIGFILLLLGSYFGVKCLIKGKSFEKALTDFRNILTGKLNYR